MVLTDRSAKDLSWSNSRTAATIASRCRSPRLRRISCGADSAVMAVDLRIRDSLRQNLTCVKSAIQDEDRSDNGHSLSLHQERLNADHQHPGLSTRPGETAVHPVALHSTSLAWVCSRSGCWPEICRSMPGPSRPSGSDLKPVMGDDGLPILGHMIEMFRGGPDYCCTCTAPAGRSRSLDSPVLPTVMALGPDAHSGASTPTATRTSRSRGGLRDRAVLQAWTDAARLRRAHVPPADHAGGVRPQPAGRLHGACRQGRLDR